MVVLHNEHVAAGARDADRLGQPRLKTEFTKSRLIMTLNEVYEKIAGQRSPLRSFGGSGPWGSCTWSACGFTHGLLAAYATS